MNDEHEFISAPRTTQHSEELVSPQHREISAVKSPAQQYSDNNDGNTVRCLDNKCYGNNCSSIPHQSMSSSSSGVPSTETVDRRGEDCQTVAVIKDGGSGREVDNDDASCCSLLSSSMTDCGSGTGVALLGVDRSVSPVAEATTDSESAIITTGFGRQREPRTTISGPQLNALLTAFTDTPKPSRQAREQLAARTGLSMRVIQVNCNIHTS